MLGTLESIGDFTVSGRPTRFDYYSVERDTWITVGLDTPLTVQANGPLLLRLRPSAREILTDLPGLEAELARQKRGRGSLKRPASEIQDTEGHKSRRLADTSVARPSGNAPPPVHQSAPPTPRYSHTKLPPTPVSGPRIPLTIERALSPTPSSSTAAHSLTTITHGNGSGRSWPFAYSVCEIDHGFHVMAEQERKRVRGETVEARYNLAWPDATKYVKTTFRKYFDAYREIPGPVKKAFIERGLSRDASFSDLTAHVKKYSRTVLPNFTAPLELVLEPLYELGDDNDVPASPPALPSLKNVMDDINLEEVSGPMCSFCGAPYPPGFQGSKRLEELYQELVQASPGTRIRLEQSAEYCNQHRFEIEHFPRALASGWPLQPEFDLLAARVVSLKADICGILVNPGENEYFEAEVTAMGENLDAISQFKETFAGYYGKRGHQIIEATLRSMFPFAECMEGKCVPLGWRKVIECVLVREVTIRLIQVDLDVDRAVAKVVLVDSSAFGASQHPEIDGEVAGKSGDGEEGDELRDHVITDDDADYTLPAPYIWNADGSIGEF
ncbi:hypothetical protein FA95DRAFT_1375840 [Auriscalpium vulgare]|uniref:Uncharacterized protein n=1 Tax=Auriscalpium vulgare TaxID=40419 RepID=A0ACB8S8P6_9AGAM|nr:hypothetical protein FA95DRAFT_1375840 [Auriscalpium vulgare]